MDIRRARGGALLVVLENNFVVAAALRGCGYPVDFAMLRNMDQPLISAIVLNYRSPRDTVKCVASLKRQSIANQMEIIVVDNHSDDESIGWIRALYQQDPMVRIVESRWNTGYGQGNMLGVAHASGKYILINNPDTILSSDGVEKLKMVMERDESIGIVAPKLIFEDGSVRPSARFFPRLTDLIEKRLAPGRWHTSYRSMMKTSADLQDVDWVAGACFLIEKKIFHESGGFDPRFFLFFEDIDLCRNVQRIGKRIVYVSSVKAIDRKERLSGGGIHSFATKRAAWIHLASALKYFWKWKGRVLS